MSRKEFIDSVLAKWVSRKLVVFGVASVGLFSGHIQSSDWVVIATAYITIEGTATVVTEIFKNKTDGPTNN